MTEDAVDARRATLGASDIRSAKCTYFVTTYQLFCMSCARRCVTTERKPALCRYSRVFFSPHIAPSPSPPLGQRNGHAVHAGNGVQEGADRVLDVLVNVTGSTDVLHEVDAVRLQCPVNPAENVERFRLIVDRVERGDEAESFPFRARVEIAQVGGDEIDVHQPGRLRLLSREGDRLLREIHPDETAPRVQKASLLRMRPRPQPTSST